MLTFFVVPAWITQPAPWSPSRVRGLSIFVRDMRRWRRHSSITIGTTIMSFKRKPPTNGLRYLFALLAIAIIPVHGAPAGDSTGQEKLSPAPAAAAGKMRFTEPAPLDFDDHEGYIALFDGVSLKDWD